MVYCDMCKELGVRRLAEYDAKTVFGYWAFLCEGCFRLFGHGLGMGRGQKLTERSNA